MRRWSEVAERVAATTRTSEKTRILADELCALGPAELPIAARFWAGRPFPEADGRTLGLGWSAIAGVVARVAGIGPDELSAAYDRHSDPGLAVADVLAGRSDPPSAERSPSLPEVAAAFDAIAAANGATTKAAVFEALLRRCDPLTATYVVKVLSGELRIGLREGLLEAAIALAFERPIADVKRASQLVGDIGVTANLARDDRLAAVVPRLFHPIKPMLASPAEDAAEILARLGPTVWVEDKYDGIRAQLHRSGTVVRLFSRDLNDVSDGYPEVVAGARELGWDGILDGELLAWRDGTVLPFLALQARLGRKRPSARILADVPVIFVAWDVLVLSAVARVGAEAEAREAAEAEAGDGAPLTALLDLPLVERRRRLEGLGLPLAADGGPFALSHLRTVDSIDGLEREFAAARERRNEGLMVKDPTSPYTPGRRGLGWLKMKRALATIDCVVVGVEVGHGKRHGLLSDYTFAVRDEAADRLVTIGKAYTGLTDAEIAEMTTWFESHTIARHGRYREVQPTVVEVAFDVIMRSARHRSGFALRFPRIARLRTDKPASEIDTLANVELLFEGLQQGAEHLVTASARR